jgi:hypothetical protein
LSYFSASVSVLALARMVTWYEVKGPNTMPPEMLKQCISREIFTEVIDMALLVKSYPDE